MREYLSPRPIAPYASLRVGASVAGTLFDVFWNGFAVGPEIGVQACAKSGFTFEVKVAADAVLGGHVAEWVPHLGPNVAVIPQASVWFGGTLGRRKVR